MQHSPPHSALHPPADAQFSKKFHLWLDEPLDWAVKVRRLRISGWCVAKHGPALNAIRARLGGEIFHGRFDRDRPEVADYLQKPDAPRFCGFTVDVEVPFGRKRLELQATAASDAWQKVFACTVTGPLRVSQAERELWRQIEERENQSRYRYHLSRPQDWSQSAHRLHVAGWCIDQTGAWIYGIRASVGERHYDAVFPIDRPDVAAANPGSRSALHSGFGVTVELPPGRCEVVLEARDANGRWHPFFSQSATGSSGPTSTEDYLNADELAGMQSGRRSRFDYWFDRPADWLAKTRHLHISGWCLAVWGDDIAELRARIRRKTFRANYGILRPDVAASYDSGRAALRSGFSCDVLVPRGTSTLVLEARGKVGIWEPLFSTRVSAPLLFAGWRDEEESVGNYQQWIREYDRTKREDVELIRRDIDALARKPVVSILLPVYNSDPRWLRRAIDSVRAQFYPHWELCAVDDASTDARIWKILEDYARRDPRIKIKRRAQNGHISATSNDALALATGEFIALLDHDDELAPSALYLVARTINHHPNAQLFYSDEDKLDKQGRRTDPYFKSDWNPDLFLAQNYVSHLSVYDAALVRQVGGFRLGFEGSQDYDLTLRCIEQLEPAQIQHIPHVLYHWRIADESTATFAAAKPYAFEAAIRAVQEHVDRCSAKAKVVAHYANYQRVVYSPPPGEPLVSIIIPTRDRLPLLRQTVESIVANTEYRNLEIIIADNDSRELETLEYLRELEASGRASVLRVEGDFNFSRLNNLGVERARGEFVALLNNDLEVMSSDWLGEMLSHAARPGIGAVGARLWYPDGTMQHGGVILGVGGVATHAHVGLRREHGYFARAHLTQNFSAVTGACLLTRRSVYQQLGGLDETNLAVAFNDVDFCLRIAAAGLRVVWTPHAELRHHESASRGLEDTGAKQRRFLAEVAFMREKWGHVLEADPFYNPNLSLESNKQFKLAFPPRVQKPWTKRSGDILVAENRGDMNVAAPKQ